MKSLREAIVDFLSAHGSRLYADRLNHELLRELSRALGSADAQTVTDGRKPLVGSLRAAQEAVDIVEEFFLGMTGSVSPEKVKKLVETVAISIEGEGWRELVEAAKALQADCLRTTQLAPARERLQEALRRVEGP